MYQKRIGAMLLVLITIIMMMVCGCGKQSGNGQNNVNGGQDLKQISVEDVALNIMEHVEFEHELHSVETEIAHVFFGTPESTKIALYMSNSGSETVAVLADNELAENSLKENVESFLADQKMSFNGYSPKDVERINQAYVGNIGDKLILVVCDYSEQVQQYVKDVTSGNIMLAVGQNVASETISIGQKETTSGGSKDSEKKEETETKTTVPEETEPVVIEPIYKSGEVKRYKGVTVVGDTGYAFFGYNEEMMEAYTGALKKLAEALDGVSTVYSVPIPMSGGITFPDNLASENTYTVQKDALDNMERMFEGKVKLVNMNDILMQHRTEYLFFRTDHHWTALGAYYGYRKFCEKKGIEPEELDSYETKVFPGFSGSYCYAEDGGVQDYEMLNNPDTITAYLPHDPSTLHIINRDGGEFDWEVIYDVTSAGAGTKYITFGVGDYPLATVHNENKHDGSACIVVKDSFANCFVPFLVDHYEYIYGIDYRYGKEHLVEFAKEHNVDDILFVVAMQNTGNGYAVGRMQEFCQ